MCMPQYKVPAQYLTRVLCDILCSVYHTMSSGLGVGVDEL